MNNTWKKINNLSIEKIRIFRNILNLNIRHPDYHTSYKRFLRENNLNIRMDRTLCKIHLRDKSLNKLHEVPKHIINRLTDLYNCYVLEKNEEYDYTDWDLISNKFDLSISPEDFKEFIFTYQR